MNYKINIDPEKYRTPKSVHFNCRLKAENAEILKLLREQTRLTASELINGFIADVGKSLKNVKLK